MVTIMGQSDSFPCLGFEPAQKRLCFEMWHGVKISMDGKGRWVDNVFVERLWRSVKYEEVYDDIRSARASLGNYFEFYNSERRHQSLDRQTPD